MTSYTSIAELEFLASAAEEATDAVKQAPAPKYRAFPWSSPPSRAKYQEAFDRYHAIYDEHGLPQAIKISPELASFLANDDALHQPQLKKFNNDSNDRMATRAFATALSTLHALVAPHPHAIAHTVRSWTKTINASKEVEIEYNRLLGERNQIARHVLSLYRLSETASGDFTLTRAHWETTLQHDSIATGQARGVTQNSYLPELCGTGVDPSIDVSSLPQLPTAGKSKGK